MFFPKRIVTEKTLSKLLNGASNTLPVGGRKVTTKCTTDLDPELMEDNKREGADNIRMVLNLSEATFDIVAVEDNVLGRIGDAEVPNTTVDTGENVSITALQLRSVRSASHVIHRDCLWSWAQLCIEDLTWRF